ncbi:Omega-amidase nit3 [Naganishia albida]|nr:Omega-amidase nit3 [Naganishia albida]
MASIVARPFKLALVQLAGLGKDKSKNLALARAGVRKAVQEGKANVVVLPEIFNSPYAVTAFRQYAEAIPASFPVPAADLASSESESVAALSGMAKENGVWLIGGSIPEIEKNTDKIYNTCTVYNPAGDLVVKHRKVHLFDIDIPGKQTFKESETLTGGTTLNTFETPFGKIGLGICYDIRFPEMAMIAARQGCVAMIYPSAFNTTTGPIYWTLLQRARAVDNQIYVAMCSPARHPDASYQAYGHSSIVNPAGQVLAEADENEAIVYADIDPQFLAETRRGLPVTVQRRFDVYPDVSKA